MKRFLQTSALATGLMLAGILGSDTAQASHIEGQEFTYIQVAPNTYLITLKLYRDCYGIPVTPLVLIKVAGVNCTTSFPSITLPMSGTGVEVSDVTPGQATSCSTPPNNSVPGVEQYTYSALVTMPVSTCATAWTFTFDDCCRNAAIVNLANPGSLSFRCQATISADTTISNSSPHYNANPVPYVCQNDTMTYMAQAFDPDGDSLVFSLIPPIDSYGPVPFAPTYSYLSPFGLSSPMTIDPATGFMTVLPTMLGDFVVAVRVDEYRTINGVAVKVGSTQRDVQYHVVQCTTPPPVANNIIVNSGGLTNTYAASQTIQVRAGNSTTVDIPAYTTANVTLSMTSNCANEIPTSTFAVTSNTGQQVTGRFSWHPWSAAREQHAPSLLFPRF